MRRRDVQQNKDPRKFPALIFINHRPYRFGETSALQALLACGDNKGVRAMRFVETCVWYYHYLPEEDQNEYRRLERRLEFLKARNTVEYMASPEHIDDEYSDVRGKAFVQPD